MITPESADDDYKYVLVITDDFPPTTVQQATNVNTAATIVIIKSAFRKPKVKGAEISLRDNEQEEVEITRRTITDKAGQSGNAGTASMIHRGKKHSRLAT